MIKLISLGGLFDLEALQQEIASNENKMLANDFWNDSVKAQKIVDQTNQLKKKVTNFTDLEQKSADVSVLIDLLSEEEDPDLQKQLDEQLQFLNDDLRQYRLQQLLGQPYDDHNAILEIHPGAGGTESQDWGQIMLRMYTRWAENHGFKVSVVNYQAGEVAGISSATLLIEGINAYGFLRSEKGVHRFVRISPFDSSGRRHTSFVSIDVMPELDDSIEIDLNPDDIKMEVFRSSGAGRSTY